MLTKKQFMYLKQEDILYCEHNEKHIRNLELELEDENLFLEWLYENCEESIGAFDSPGLDVYCFLFEYEELSTIVVYQNY